MELDTQFTPNVYFWTPNCKNLTKALDLTQVHPLHPHPLFTVMTCSIHIYVLENGEGLSNGGL